MVHIKATYDKTRVLIVLIVMLVACFKTYAQQTKPTDTISSRLVISEKDLKEDVLRFAEQLLESSDFKGSWPMFNTGLRMKIGGYLKADFLYDADGTRDKSQFLMSTIPVEGEPDFGDEGVNVVYMYVPYTCVVGPIV